MPRKEFVRLKSKFVNKTRTMSRHGYSSNDNPNIFVKQDDVSEVSESEKAEDKTSASIAPPNEKSEVEMTEYDKTQMKDAIDETLAIERAKRERQDANRKAIIAENEKVLAELERKSKFLEGFTKIQSLGATESPETRRARQGDIQLPQLPQMPTQEYNPNRFQYFVKQ